MDMTRKGKVHACVCKGFANLLPILNRECSKEVIFIFKVLNKVKVRKTEYG